MTTFCLAEDDQVVVTIDNDAPVAVAVPFDTITCANPIALLNGAGSSTGASFHL